MRPQHRAALVRPGPHSLAWLEHTLRKLKSDDPLQPVTVVARSPYLVAVLRQSLAGFGSANVSFSGCTQLPQNLTPTGFSNPQAAQVTG